MSDPPLTDSERTRRQGERLKRLRERLGVSKGRLMDAVGLKTTNGYDLYERGSSVIRFNQVAEWAAAFGISEREFVDEVLEPDRAGDERASWDFLAELRRVLPHDPDRADRHYAEWSWAPEKAQRVMIEALERLDMTATYDPNDDHRSAIAEARTGYKIRHTGT